MPGSESPLAISSGPSALKKPVKKHNTRSDGNDEHNDTNVPYNAADHADIMLRQMQSEVFVAPWTKNLPRLDNFCSEAIAVIVVIIGALAGLNKLRSNAEQGQVPLLLDGVSAEDFQKLRKSALRQPLNVIIAGKYWTVALAERAFKLQ